MISRRQKILCVGDALVDFLSVTPLSSLEDSLRFEKSPGGSALNCAVIARRLGAEVAFSTALGKDVFGRYLHTFLALEGIDVSSVISMGRGSTGVAFASSPNGSVQFHIIRGDNLPASALTREDVPHKVISECSFVHLCSLLVYQFAPFSFVKSVVDSAEKSGSPVTFDPNVRPHAIVDVDEARKRFDYLISKASLVKMSDDDGRWLYPGVVPKDYCTEILRNGRTKLVVVTRGPKGSMAAFFSGPTLVFVECSAVGEPLGDTVGAGDAFMAALLSHLCEDGHLNRLNCLCESSVHSMLKFASAASHCVCQKFGALSGLPSRDVVDIHLES